MSDIPAGDGKTVNLFLKCSTSEGGVEVLELGNLQTHHQVPGLYTNIHLKGLSHEIDFKNFDKDLQNLT